jgi:hypothetical protein
VYRRWTAFGSEATQGDLHMPASISSRTPLVWAPLALAYLLGAPASAELPQHAPVQTFFPLGSEVDWLPGEPPQRTEFGRAVVIRNGLAFIGIPFAVNIGHVAVFTQTASGWTRTATLTASDPTQEGEFGRSVTFRDGLLVVGSVNAAYVFTRKDGAWKQIQRIAPPAADSVISFADALRYESGTLAVSGRSNNTAGDQIYVYERDATGRFVRRATLRASDGFRNDRFGAAIGMTNAVILIGAPGKEGLNPTTGAAYIFGQNSSGRWVQRQRLIAVESEPGDDFGAAVAIDKGMILVGAPHVDPEGGPIGPFTPDGHVAEGAVYGFLPGSGRYVESLRLRPRSDEMFRYSTFGKDIAMFDTRVAIAASEPTNLTGDAPAAIVFTYTRSGAAVIALASVRGVPYTTSLSIANNLLLIGSPFENQCAPAGCAGSASVVDLTRIVQ